MNCSKLFVAAGILGFCAIPFVRADDTSDQAKAREAVEQKIHELNGREADKGTYMVSTNDAEATDAAQAAVERKISELNQQQMSTSAPATTMPVETKSQPAQPTSSSLPPATVNYPGADLGLKPITAPPPPISPEQQAELQTLDAKYFSNQITPDEYHKKRAEILGLPDVMNH